MDAIKEISEKLCTGCGACSNACPSQAIDMQLVHGFLKPVIDNTKCIECKKCEKICPVLNREYTSLPQCFAVWADNITRFKSSSGGAFPVMAKAVLREKGVVFGATWTEDFYVRHTFVENEKDLEKLYRSKYVQSNLGNSYNQVKKFLNAGRKVMFVGTPCQVAGLERFLEYENMENLIMVDFICYYNPPISILRRYLDERYGLENLKRFTFRDKSNGWMSHCTKAELKDGSVITEKKIDSYFNGYFKGLYARQACNDCTFSGNHHHADVTLGDFWKIEEHDSSWNDGRGTSMIMANTLKGRLFVEKLKSQFQRFQNVPKEWIRKGQSNCKIPHPGKEYFENLLEYKPFDEAVDKALNGKYDIGMVCVQSYKNYGSAFTNYALYKVLRDLGYSVLIITQPLSSEIKPENSDNFAISPFKKFENAEHYNNIEAMKALNEKCEMFIVGSDQLFNYEIYKKIDGFVKLNWVDDAHKKICYATSFGVDKILGTFEESVSLKKALNRFQAISIREESGVELVRKNFKVDATRAMDPVFLCDKDNYVKLCSSIHISNTGIFAYVLDPNSEKEEALRMLSEKMDKDLCIYVDRWMSKTYINDSWSLQCQMGRSNEEWLKSLISCDFVFTDSFHGMCMAIIFEKQFVVINNRKRGSTRFTSLLNILNLKERMFDSPKEFIEIYDRLEKIDYAYVNSIIDKEKEHSLEWLKNAIRVKQ